MMQQCANPDCCSEFRYFRGGKIYRFPTRNLVAENCNTAADELFWLCGRCFPTLRLMLGVDGRVLLQAAEPLPRPTARVTAVGWGLQRTG